MPKLSILLIVLVFGLSGCLLQSAQKTINLNGRTIKVEIVSKIADQAKGLSGRTSLCQDCGMLFVFTDYQIRNFWMKDMEFPLDIVWLKDNLVVGWQQNIPLFGQNGQVQTMSSPEAINAVLELNSGWIKQNSLKLGDRLQGLD